MELDFQHLLIASTASIRYRGSEGQCIDQLLARATACVIGRQGGRRYLDIIVDADSQYVEFDDDAAFQEVLGKVKALGIPVHRTRDILLVLFGAGSILISAILLSAWLRP